ncbi:hypothetical protein [Breoghania sp.]|uniref:DUF58 domain-containing protein n=1 Tax=Breoghania sp. TaxID=2065378 RepID=UPI002AA75EB0|nr:hypothetical protein [Breoghania sp.]
MTDEALHLFDVLTWRLARALPGVRVGGHRARMRGAGDIFADTAGFFSQPDLRRIDLRRSLTDPFANLVVRRFETRNDLTVHLLLDASASLGTGARSDRPGIARLLAYGIAQAAWRGRDRFAIDVLNGDDIAFSHGPSHSRATISGLRTALPHIAPAGHGVKGLTRCAAGLPDTRILVVLVSDFEYAPDELRWLLSAVHPRPAWPIWLRDSGLEEPNGRFGITETRDPETGRRRSELTTRRWAQTQSANARRRRAETRGVFSEFGLRAVEIRDRIDVNALAVALDEAPL